MSQRGKAVDTFLGNDAHVTAMTAVLFMMMSGMWRSVGSSLNDSLTDARIAQEAHFVLEIMRRDLGGFLPGEEDEDKDENKLVGLLATVVVTTVVTRIARRGQGASTVRPRRRSIDPRCAIHGRGVREQSRLGA